MAKKPTLKDTINSLRLELEDVKNKYDKVVTAPVTPIQKSASRLNRTATELRDYQISLMTAESAENPLFYKVAEVNRSVSENGAVANALDIRKSYILSREYTFKNKLTGEIDEKSTSFFSKSWFGKFQEYVIESIMEGYKLIKIQGIQDDELTGIEIVQPQNVNPVFKTILTSPYSKEGIDFTDDKFNDWYILVSDSDNYLGVYSKVAPYAIIHKSAILAMNDYVNRFGSPNILVKTDINNINVTNQIVKYLENFNNSSYSIANLTDDIELIESSGKGGEIYKTVEDKMEDLIYKLILGSPLSNEQQFVGSANIRQSIANLYSLKDIKLVEHFVNNELLPRLVNLGLTFLDNIIFEYDSTNKIDPSVQFTQLLSLLQSGQFTVEADWIETTFGIPVKAIAPALFKEENNNTPDVSEQQ